MALVVSSIGADSTTVAGQPGKQALGKDNMVKGTLVRFVSIKVQNADYSSGFDIGSIRGALGLRAIFGARTIGAKNGAGSTILNYWDQWDFQTVKLRVMNATSEANASGLFTDNSVIHLIVWGV